MKNILIIPAFAATLFACNNNDEKPGTVESPAAVKDSPEVQANCYTYINAKDTARLSMQTTGNTITGDLMFNFFEKDKNTGTITGEMRGDTVIVDYVFQAEGMTSTRQEVFLKKGNDVVQGYGDAEEKNGKWVYKNIASLDFNKGLLLKQTDCKK